MKRGLITLVILALYSAWQMWDIDRFGHSDDGSKADCAIVLGAAAWHNKPSPVFKARINHAIKLYESGRVNSIILTGGFGEGAAFAESEVAMQYCVDRGIPREHIFIETKSLTTKENILEAKLLMHDRSETALIVSDPWHLKRACAIAEHYELSVKPSATTTSLYTSNKSIFNFIWKEFLYIHLWRFS